MSGGDLSIITICREFSYVLPKGNLKVDLSHINMGELSTELEAVQDIRSSACHILNALPRLHYHDLIVVDDLRWVYV